MSNKLVCVFMVMKQLYGTEEEDTPTLFFPHQGNFGGCDTHKYLPVSGLIQCCCESDKYRISADFLFKGLLLFFDICFSLCYPVLVVQEAHMVVVLVTQCAALTPEGGGSGGLC